MHVNMKASFQELIGSDTPVLIDFHAEWCGPCKAQSPIIKEVAMTMKGKVHVIKIDIDKNQALATRYDIRAVPTLALFRKGKLIWSRAGLMSKQQIIDVVYSALQPENS